MNGTIKTTKDIFMINGLSHDQLKATVVKFTGKKTWRALQMAIKKGGFDFAAVALNNGIEDYGMQYANCNNGKIAPTKECELWYYWK